MKNILVISQYFWPEDFRINDFCDILQKNNHSITVLTSQPNYPQGAIYSGYKALKFSSEVHNGYKIYRVPTYPRKTGKSFHLLINYIFFFIFSHLALFYFLFKKYDHIFTLGTTPVFQATAGVILGKLKNIPVSIWIMDLWPESLSATNTVNNKFVLKLIRKLVHILYMGTDHILCISKSFMHHLEKMGIPTQKIKYFPNWAEESYSEITEPAQLVAWPKGTVITYAGNIGVAQDMECLIDTMIQLKNIPDLHLAIFGDGRESEKLKKLISLHHLNQVHYFGRKPQTEMAYYFSKSDALLVTLKKDDLFSMTLPGRVQSFMVSQKPILGCIDGETATIISDATCGYCAEAGNSQNFAKIIRHFYNLTEPEKKQLGLNGFEYFEKNFNRRHVYKRYKDLL